MPDQRRYYEKLIRQALDAKSILAMAIRQLGQANNIVRSMDKGVFHVDNRYISQALNAIYSQQDELKDVISTYRSELR